jgi:(2Fe-2S) ferredoxin
MGGCNGFGYESFSLKESVVLKADNHYYTNISGENAKKIIKMHNEILDKKSEVSNLILDLEILLYSLRTYSKVSENFPEAIPFLPKKLTTGLSINISDIRKRI